MRVLVITNLFPNASVPNRATFNRLQFAALGALCDVEVIAPIPWFPGAERFRKFDPFGDSSRVPSRETIDGLDVAHPHTLYIPKVGRVFGGPLFAASLLRDVASRRGRVDVVLGSWAYPDGWAAILLARWLGVPAVVKIHGSDINVVAKMWGPRVMLATMLPRAAGVVAVSQGLARAALVLGAHRDRVHVVYNGVDGELFQPRDRGEARSALGLDAEQHLILYVGRLLSSKGATDLLRAFARVADSDPQARLAMIGSGAEEDACRELAAPFGDRVAFVGQQRHEQIAGWLAACDVLCLPSHAEGTPNVILEALAAGRRVVATDVGGIPDLITSVSLGRLVPPHDTDQLAEALIATLSEPYDQKLVAKEGRRGDWQASAQALHDVLVSVTVDDTRRP